ncbi:putative alcohol dehydrogenase [Trichoderma camerunense]
MAEEIPKTSKQWRVTGYDGFDALKFMEEEVPILSDNYVLVKIQGASLNFRDIIIPLGKYPFSQKPNVVPGSDGAGTVLAVGKNVTRFRPGDKVVTILNQRHLAGSMDAQAADSGLGGSIDGTMRSVGAFDEQGLVKMPEGLNFIDAATLSCAGLTAWNALFGLLAKQLMAGQWVLTQGTGGVSIFAIQFAKLVGARVIATTSSDEKAKLLKSLGADHIINYRQTLNWGEVAKELTGGIGVDLVVEVAGALTMKQSVASLKLDGTMSVVGFVGGEGNGAEVPNLLDPWLKHYTVRGISVGSRQQMEAMCLAIEANLDKLRPIVDSRVFELEELRDAYKYLQAGENLGKVCINIE